MDKRLEWLREKLQHGLDVEGSLVDEVCAQQRDAITSYLDGGELLTSHVLLTGTSSWRYMCSFACKHFAQRAHAYTGILAECILSSSLHHAPTSVHTHTQTATWRAPRSSSAWSKPL